MPAPRPVALLLMLAGLSRLAEAAIPDFTRHPLAHRSNGAPASIWAPEGAPAGSPGFAAIRGFSTAGCENGGAGPCGPTVCAKPGANCSAPVPAWTAAIDQMFNSTAEGGLDLANCVWPGWSVVFSEYFPDLARLLMARKAPAVDLGGFVPGGRQEFDVHAGVPSQSYLDAGMAIMGDYFMGLDMGEQDVRYLWGYAPHTVLPGPGDHFEQYMSFRDYSFTIEWKAGGRLASLSSTVYAHYWLKSGLYTTAGAETSQSNGNAQMLYAFIRGAGKSYGVPWYGQVSIFNWFGYKIPGDPSPTHPPGPNQCIDQGSHSATCGTSLSLMKRLMYTQLLYDSCYFAFEGQWTYAASTADFKQGTITPIGTLQQQAKRFFANTTDLGQHVAHIAVMLDFFGGWARPCDNKHGGYSAVAWGNGAAWDGADYLADAVFDMAYPGYRGGAMNHDESYYLSPTPYGDSVDTILNDALPSVIGAYSHVVVAHRMTAEPQETLRKLSGFVAGGGTVIITASSVLDLGGEFAGVSVGGCQAVTEGATFSVAGEAVAEPMPLSICKITPPSNATVLASMHSEAGADAAAVRVEMPGGGAALVLAHGNYAMSTAAKTGDVFKCGIDDDPHASRQPYQLAQVARRLIDATLRNASLFDLGRNLSFVPKRVSDTQYILGVSNNQLRELPLRIESRLGRVAHVEELSLDQSEKTAVGYLPHGFEHSDLGSSTSSTIAGADMRIFRVDLEPPKLQPVVRTGLATTSSDAPRARVLLRLSARISSIRTEIEKRPSFFNYFAGVVVDSEYITSRSRRALEIEDRWLKLQGVQVVCDFTRSTNLFPGLRLIDDIPAYYNESMRVIDDVLQKLPLIRSQHAMLTLHGSAELGPAVPCANAAGQEAGANFTACFQRTLSRLAAQARILNVTLHLRASSRNEAVCGSTLPSQATFAASIDGSQHFKIAASTSMAAPAALTAMVPLLGKGAAEIVLLSSAASAPLVDMPQAQHDKLRAVVQAARAADALLVLDAGFARNAAENRDAELTDAHFLRTLRSSERTKTDDQDLSFSAGFSSHMVLQRAPAKAAVYGFGAGPVTVKVVSADSAGLEKVSYSVNADAAAKADDGGAPTWKAFLKPMKAGGSYTITATGSAGSATLEHVTLGDVYFCSGQSNMALSTHYTFSADTARAAFAGGQYKGLRLFQFGGMAMNTTLASYSPRYVTASQSVAADPLHGSWYTAEQSTSVVMSNTSDKVMTAFDTFSATCLYFGLELIDALGDSAPPIGLIQSAVGGSTVEAWQANETRAECTDRMVPHAGLGGGHGGFPFMQHQPGALYYGYVTPFVNMSIFGFLWYQGENNCGMRNVGNSADGTGYACEISKMVAAWREVWSAVPGTTDPRAPFGIATLASGGSEGNDAHMANMRNAQTASFGRWDNEALPNTFGAQLYDLGDPWGHAGTGDGNELTAAGNETRCCADYQNCQHPAGNWTCTAAQNASNAACEARGQTGKACSDRFYCANVNPATGKYGPECAAWNSSLWWGTLKQQEPLVRKNAPSGIPALNYMGGIHPRLKRPVGRRLAAAIVNLVPDYREIKQGSATAGTGPTLSGCTRGSSSLVLHFNKSLLGSEQLLLRPFDADMRNWAWRYDSSHTRLNKTDSAGLMVCTASADPEVPGNATTCACSTWEMLEINGTQVRYCGQGPGWKPSPEMIAAGKPAKDQNNPFASQWMALPLHEVDGQQEESATASVSVDLAPLGGREPLAVRLAWPMFATRVGSADDMCCVHAATQSDTSHAPGNAAGGPVGGIAPCVPGNCPLYSSVSELPANPFFAAISGGKCACEKPQVCDETVRPAAIKTDDADGVKSACSTDADCNGGVCAGRSCRCPPLWAGERCTNLSLAPATVKSGLRLNASTTWGGGLLREPSGVWHMYAAQMIDGCGLKTWTSNSLIIHAVSDEVQGPYRPLRQPPVLNTFSHNPTVQQLTASSFVLGHIGCGNETKSPQVCHNGSTCTSNQTWCHSPGALSTGASAAGRSCDNPHWTGLRHATSPRGPWQAVSMSGQEDCGLQVDGGADAWHTPCITNPSFWPFENGSVLMAYSTGCANCSVSAGHKHIGLAFGATFAGPFTDLTPHAPVFPFASEDPNIFLDTTNNLHKGEQRFHIIAHTDFSGVAEEGTWQHVSAHAIAASPFGPWQVVEAPPYTRTITWEGGEEMEVYTRERPQLIFEVGADGKRTPVALTNGVTPGNSTVPGRAHGYTGDWSYTHVQRVRLV